MSSARRTLRERCGFTLFISFTPAFPKMIAKGHLEPTAGNLPRRKRSSVVSLEIPAPAPITVPIRIANAILLVDILSGIALMSVLSILPQSPTDATVAPQ
ncbi:hypothetical protein B0H14DRAFT_3514260 [Mycena olivaceomarginata]|nr:hypothetical protein B0H14DRAFT_3514260 [Mycena olivaceomarginata]